MDTYYRFFLYFKKRTAIAIAISCSLLFTARTATAQQNLTLLECIEYAIEHNLDIEQARITERISEVDLRQAKFDLAPDISGSASHQFSVGNVVNPNTNVIEGKANYSGGSFALNSSLLLFAGFQQINAIAQAKYNTMANKSAVEKIKQQVMVNVASTFLQVLYAKEQTAASQEQVNISKAQVENAQKKVEVGTIPKGELLQLQATLGNDELLLTQAQNNYDIYLLNLKNLLNINPSTPFGIEAPSDVALEQIQTDYTLSEVFTKAVEINPALREASERRLAAEENLQIAKGALLPTLTLGAGIGTNYSYRDGEGAAFNTQLDNFLSKQVGFTLNIPIFNKFQARNTVKRARLNLEGAQVTENLSRNELNQTIAQALADLRAAEKTYASAQRAYESASLAFEYAQKRFDVGLTNAIELNLSKTQLAQTEADMLQAKYDLIFRSKVIDYYLGRSLAF